MCDGHDEQQEMVDKFRENGKRARGALEERTEAAISEAILAQQAQQSIDDCCDTHEEAHRMAMTNDGVMYNPFAQEKPVKYTTAPEQEPLYVVPDVAGISYAAKKSFENSYRVVKEPELEEHRHYIPLAMLN